MTNEPVTDTLPETPIPPFVSVITESFKWSPPADLAIFPDVNDNSEPNEPELRGPESNIPPP